jgi:hypothetical protein
MMGVVKNRHGTYNAQQKVPAPLQVAVASLLGKSKSRQKWLKKSLGTKDQREAHIRAKPVLMGFDRLLADAAALMKQRPLRTTLAQAEIDRIAEYHFATTLSWDEEDAGKAQATKNSWPALLNSLRMRAWSSKCRCPSPHVLHTVCPTEKLPSGTLRSLGCSQSCRRLWREATSRR